MGKTRKRLLALALQLALPFSLLACYQLPGPPTRIPNDHLEVNFAYEGRPLTGAVIMLYNRKEKVMHQAFINKDGWVVFPKVRPGTYKLAFDGPSHETFDIVLETASSNASRMYVSFYADYCYGIGVRRDLRSYPVDY